MGRKALPANPGSVSSLVRRSSGWCPSCFSENGNRRGYNVFITPFSDTVWYILLDDIVPAKLAELEGLRLTPQMLIESSPQRFQGLFMLPKDLATKDEANALFRMINARHGDPKISGLTHPFRATGFRNMKPKYQKPNGFYPFAGMVWGGKPMPDGLVPLLEEAKALVRVIAPKERRSKRVLKSLDASATRGARPGDDEVRPGALPAAGVAIWQGV